MALGLPTHLCFPERWHVDSIFTRGQPVSVCVRREGNSLLLAAGVLGLETGLLEFDAVVAQSTPERPVPWQLQ